MKFWLIVLLLTTSVASAQMQQTPIPSTSLNSVRAATIGAVSGMLIDSPPPGARRVYLRLANQSSVATVRCAWGTTAAISADTAGQESLLPYAQMIWEGNYTPNDRLNCISSAGPSPLTLQVGP